MRDENTVTWSNIPGRMRRKNQEFAEARDLILGRINSTFAETKICPECAESVKPAANVCGFCGYRFSAVG